MLSIFILLVLLASPCASWTTSAYMNLVSPPRLTTGIGDAYIVKNGEIQEGYTNHLGSCLNKLTPANITRTPFPITGGELRFAFVNNSAGPPDERFSIDMYFTDDDADYSSTGSFRWGGLKRMLSWENFETGWSCSVPLEMKGRLRQPENATAVAMLNGLNVTFALLIQSSRNSGLFEEVDQCAYVTLTADHLKPRNENTDMCSKVNLDYFGNAATPSAPLNTFECPTSAGDRSGACTVKSGVHAGLSFVFIFLLAIGVWF